MIEAGELRACCLEIHDLVLSKLAAGRLKDNEMVAALLSYKLADINMISSHVNGFEIGGLIASVVCMRRSSASGSTYQIFGRRIAHTPAGHLMERGQ